MQKKIIKILIAIIMIINSSCIQGDFMDYRESVKCKFKYSISTDSGLYYSTSEIIYMSGGCIKFVGFWSSEAILFKGYNKLDTIIICGSSFAIERYAN